MMPLLHRARLRRGGPRRAPAGCSRSWGSGDRLDHRPGALSGGEQQRVAVARALACSPRALLADEPTGNLDRETGDRLHDLLRRLNQEKGITVVVVTHNERLAAACDRTLRLEAGVAPLTPRALAHARALTVGTRLCARIVRSGGRSSGRRGP